MSRIALDYDGTYTADPALWTEFIARARSKGHQVFIVTMRHNSDQEASEVLEAFYAWMGLSVDGIIFTGREAKKAHLAKRGILPMDIWIDDNPEWVLMDAAA